MFIATQRLFMQKGKIIKLIDGVTMVSCPGPTLANFCLRFLEKSVANTNKFSPNLCLGYINDDHAFFDITVIALVHSFLIFSIQNTNSLNLPYMNCDNLSLLDMQIKLNDNGL